MSIILAGVSMYPLKCDKKVVPKVWGGRRLEDLLSIQLPGSSMYGESWELSVRKDVENCVVNGEFCGEGIGAVVSRYSTQLLGAHTQSIFPVLIKYLDIHDRLSIQVHPDDQCALSNGDIGGKYESWYVLDASDDIEVVMGVKEGVGRREISYALQRQRYRDVFRCIHVRSGDFIDIVPGTVHGTLSGSMLIYEIQQNADTTYRLYDFEREYGGATRTLHEDKAYCAIRYGKPAIIIRREERCYVQEEWGRAAVLTDNPFYRVMVYEISGECTTGPEPTCAVLSCTQGSVLLSGGGEHVEFSAGETVLLPAGIECTLQGTAVIMYALPQYL